MPANPFQLDALLPLPRFASAALRPILARVLGLDRLAEIHRTARVSAPTFEDRVLEALDIKPEVDAAALEQLPRTGPLVVAANHPHGALDGLALAAVVRRVRPDVRLLANHLLKCVPELADICFFVDPFEGPATAARNLAGLRAAHVWLRRGGALVVFPAGEVAHDRVSDKSRRDSDWKDTVGRLALSSGATAVPAFIEGTNSRLFYAAGHLHPTLRTLLLPREFLKKRGASVVIRIGAPIERADRSPASSAADVTHRLRQEVDSLAAASTSIAVDRSSGISDEIEGLPREACLIDGDAYQVFCANATQIPVTLQEIGRLREVTYRAAGEGTGQEIDLDRFDQHYLHLFVWDRRSHLVVGAYRLGESDRIVARAGNKGLYTRTLFRYDERLLARMSPALELGRAFVRQEYQRDYSALLLLWKGIGQFVARHPQYRVLFGPVSISARYSDVSVQLLIAFLQQNHRDRELSELVEAIHPFRLRHAADGLESVPSSIDEAARRLAADGRGMPVLLRQYLKLNARLIGVNVDPNFSDAIDALMMVDLCHVDRGILNRYLGRENAVRFLSCHRGARRVA